MVDPLSLALYGIGALSKTIRRIFLVISVLLMVGALFISPDANGKYGTQLVVFVAGCFVLWYWLIMSILATIKWIVARDLRS